LQCSANRGRDRHGHVDRGATTRDSGRKVREQDQELVTALTRDDILITHHIEEIVPEIQRIVLVNHGRIAGAGPKRDMLTTDRVSALFNAPIALEEDDGYFYARPTLAAKK